MRSLLFGLTFIAFAVAAGALAVVWYGQHPENRVQYHEDYRLALAIGLLFFFVGVMTGTQKNINLALAIAIAFSLVMVTPQAITLILERNGQSSAYEHNVNWADINRWAEMTLVGSFVLFFLLAVLHLCASRYLPQVRSEVGCDTQPAAQANNAGITSWNTSEATVSS